MHAASTRAQRVKVKRATEGPSSRRSAEVRSMEESIPPGQASPLLAGEHNRWRRVVNGRV
jgi:hypothetical protein